jgi:hypothetical protein
MRKSSIVLVLVPLFLGLLGCTMFVSWRSIPPPGGCDQCHTLPISADWRVALKPVALADESGRESWQKGVLYIPAGDAPLQEQKLTEERCFRCHKSPDRAHADYRGRYHH